MKLKLNKTKLFMSSLFYIHFTLTLFLISSCISTRIAIKPGYDFTKIKTVGILPFIAPSGHTNVGITVRDEFMRQLILNGIDVRELSIMTPGSFDAKTWELSGMSGIDVVITGNVTYFTPEKKYMIYQADTPNAVVNQPIITEVGGANVYSWGRVFGAEGKGQIILTGATISLTAKMIDVYTGDVVWIHKYTYEGLDVLSTVEGAVTNIMDAIRKVWIMPTDKIRMVPVK